MGCGGAKAEQPDKREALPTNFEEKFDLEEKISAGKLSYNIIGDGYELWKVKDKESGEFRVVKIVKKPLEGETEENIDNFYDEKDKLIMLDSPNILKAYDAFEDEGAYYLVIDYLQGVNLLDYLGKTPKTDLNEQKVANYVSQILAALAHCHSKDIIHGDLRPSNVVFADAEGKTLKLIDFRNGRAFDTTDSKNQEIFGPAGYAGPEVINNKEYIPPSDIWSCGILTCYMISDQLPYGLNDKSTVEELFEKIKGAAFTTESFKGGVWDKISADGKKFIASMLESDPEKRLTADALVQDAWLRNTTTTPFAKKEETKAKGSANPKGKGQSSKTQVQPPKPTVNVAYVYFYLNR